MGRPALYRTPQQGPNAVSLLISIWPTHFTDASGARDLYF